MKNNRLALLRLGCFAFLTLFTLSSPVLAQKIARQSPAPWGNTIEIDSDILSEKRIIDIRLPMGYGFDKKKEYPVVYVLADRVEDSWGKVAMMYRSKEHSTTVRVPASIVVEVRNVDSTWTNSDKVNRFLTKEVIPYVEKNYKVSKERTLVGYSVTGLAVAGALIHQPSLFNQYIIIDPGHLPEQESLANVKFTEIEEAQPVKAYIAVGAGGISSALAKQLTEHKHLVAHIDYLPQEVHENSLVQGLFHAVSLLYGTKK